MVELELLLTLVDPVVGYVVGVQFGQLDGFWMEGETGHLHVYVLRLYVGLLQGFDDFFA